VLVTVGSVGVGAVELLRAPVMPPPDTLLRLLLASVPVVLGTGLPLAVLAAISSVLSRWEEEGSWLTLQACGLSGRALLPGLVLLGLGTAGASYALAHHLEPAARSSLRESLREGLLPVAGRPIDLGGGMVVAERVDGDQLRDVFFASDAEGLVGSARSARFDGDALLLSEGRAHAPGPPEVAVSFEEARVPIQVPDARVELVERSTQRLRELVERMEQGGRDATYERAVLTKRTAWPVSAGLFALLAAPLALRRRAHRVAAVVLGYWVAVRLCDGATTVLGGVVAGWTPTIGLGVLTLLTWMRWDER